MQGHLSREHHHIQGNYDSNTQGACGWQEEQRKLQVCTSLLYEIEYSARQHLDMLCALQKTFIECPSQIPVAQLNLKVDVLHPQPLRLIQHWLAQRQFINRSSSFLFLQVHNTHKKKSLQMSQEEL
jgi:hypothetical protein